MTDIRRHLHRFPELAWQESKTTEFISNYLVNLGLEIIPWGGKSGLVALLRGGRPGPAVALRADMDALPIQENNRVGYQSTVAGVMHACGHDAHVACALGAARLLAERASSLSGAVKFIFQPAEELGGGASAMIDKAVLDAAEIQAVFALHCRPDLAVGSIGLNPGPVMAANDIVSIRIRGIGGHGAMPHQTRDPIISSAAIILALQTLVSRQINPLEAAVISFGTIYGGSAGNVIPEYVDLKGTIRTFEPAVREALKVKMKHLVENMAIAMGTAAEVTFDAGYPAVINPLPLTLFCRKSLQELLPEGNIPVVGPVMVTEDFAEFQQIVPGVLLWLGTGSKNGGTSRSWHNPDFDIDEAALPFGAAALAKLAIDYLAQRS